MPEMGYFFITGKRGIGLQFIFNRLLSYSHSQLLKCIIWADVYAANAPFHCSAWEGDSVLTKPAFFSHTEKPQSSTENLAGGKKEMAEKVFFQYTPLMSWGEICIAWWLRNPGNYLRAPRGLICDEYRLRDNASQSIPVWECQWEQQLPWFSAS